VKYIKWTFWITFWILFLAFLHYTLPQRDIVRITDTENRRIDFGENSIFWAQADSGNDANVVNRDVFFILTVQDNGAPMAYRNEDTGAGWPPYFKFDTTNLQTQAADAVSTAAEPRWYAVTHYGWRNEYFSIFPNAIAINPVEGPDVRLIPWLNIIILTFIAAVFWAIWVRWRRFKARRITPVFESAEDAIEERRAGVSRWFASWRKKPR